ncbi:MAG: hypothetical protein Q4B80_01725 [Aerococcaceae bacterium]|nr:hypothetical protein [Aerococcaceae bacterium]
MTIQQLTQSPLLTEISQQLTVGDRLYLVAEGNALRLEINAKPASNALEILFLTITQTPEIIQHLLKQALYVAELTL